MAEDLDYAPAENDGVEPTRSPDALPRMLFDISLSKIITNIEVDIEYIADEMSLAGMSDDDISATTLHITSASVLRATSADGDHLYGYGEHNKDEHIAAVFVGSVLDTMNHPFIDPPTNEDDFNIQASFMLSEHTMHEIGHEVDLARYGADALAEENMAYYGVKPKDSFTTRLIKRVLSSKLFADNEELLSLLDQLTLINKQKAVRSARGKGTYEQYQGEPQEIRQEQFAEKIDDYFVEVGEYPVRVVFVPEKIRLT